MLIAHTNRRGGLNNLFHFSFYLPYYLKESRMRIRVSGWEQI